MKIYKIEDHQIQIDKALYTLLSASTGKASSQPGMKKPFYNKTLNKICATDGRRLTLTEELTTPLPPETLYFNFYKENRNFFLLPVTLNETPLQIESVLPTKKNLIHYQPKKKEYFLELPKNPINYATTIFKLFNFLKFPLNLDYLKPLKGGDFFKLSYEDYKVQITFNSGTLYIIMGILLE